MFPAIVRPDLLLTPMPRGFYERRPQPRAATDPERFWRKVRRGAPNECWPWIGARDRAGYGRVTQAGATTNLRAHRLALAYAGVAVPNDLCVLHACDNPPCCNPSHLRVGTYLDNAKDRSERGRGSQLRGERVPTARLTADRVRAIREAAGLESQTAIARRFGIAQTTVSAIVTRKTWSHA